MSGFVGAAMVGHTPDAQIFGAGVLRPGSSTGIIDFLPPLLDQPLRTFTSHGSKLLIDFYGGDDIESYSTYQAPEKGGRVRKGLGGGYSEAAGDSPV